eukprot:scaffold336_cov384-Prasinococcus_capsulatus_cf.AAC.16
MEAIGHPASRLALVLSQGQRASTSASANSLTCKTCASPASPRAQGYRHIVLARRTSYSHPDCVPYTQGST